MKNCLVFVLLCLFVGSCTDIAELKPTVNTFGGGAFILNEGNFRAGNGSLSFYSYDSSKIYNDLFYSVNGRHLGDVPNSMIINAATAYIVVNNSGKIEVIDPNTIKSKATIEGLISPRNMTIITDYKAYVTSIYSDSVTIINLMSNTISGYINIMKSSEAIITAGNKAYISNWMGGKKIMVINTLTDKVADSIDVGVEPESMVMDRFGKLWVLCNGGWTRQNFAELDVINTITDHVEKKYVFPTLQNSPTSLKIDGSGLTLFFLDKGVRQMSIDSDVLPGGTLISETDAYFYKIAINPINSDIIITDAADFTQKGSILIYKNNGAFVSKYAADVIPGSICFK